MSSIGNQREQPCFGCPVLSLVDSLVEEIDQTRQATITISGHIMGELAEIDLPNNPSAEKGYDELFKRWRDNSDGSFSRLDVAEESLLKIKDILLDNCVAKQPIVVEGKQPFMPSRLRCANAIADAAVRHIYK